jgi:hypothetical protein
MTKSEKKKAPYIEEILELVESGAASTDQTLKSTLWRLSEKNLKEVLEVIQKIGRKGVDFEYNEEDETELEEQELDEYKD